MVAEASLHSRSFSNGLRDRKNHEGGGGGVFDASIVELNVTYGVECG